MLYDYIIANYDKDEPIFLSELPGNSKDYVRQEMKQLVDDRWIIRKSKSRCSASIEFLFLD